MELDAMLEIVSGAEHATFINTFEPSDRDEIVRINIDIIDNVVSTLFISAIVHRSTDCARVFNCLQWESTEHPAAMQRSAEFQAIARRFTGLIEFEPHQCEVVHVGERD